MKRFIALAAALALAACAPPPPASTEVVAQMPNGCVTVRIMTGQDYNPVFSTMCPGGGAKVNWSTTQNCGKGCVRTLPHEVETVPAP